LSEMRIGVKRNFFICPEEALDMDNASYAVAQNQKYEDGRNGLIYEVLFANSDIVVLNDGRGNHRLDARDAFEDNIEAGRMEPEGNVERTEEDTTETGSDTVEVPLGEIEWVGEVGIKSLQEHDITTARAFNRTSDSHILNQCRGIGEKGLNNIRDWIQNHD